MRPTQTLRLPLSLCRTFRFPHSREKGFALIATICLLVLVALVCVGLLSLSSVSLRGSQRSEAQLRAQANARLALLMAIGQLQKAAGVDQRITAPAELSAAGTQMPAERKGWVGVWKSAPTTATQFQPGRKDSFLTWLVSSPDAAVMETAQAAPGTKDAVISRLGNGSETRVPLVPVQHGNLAWWTSDEAAKATVDLANNTPQSDGEHLQARHAPPTQGPEAIDGLAAFSKEPNLTNKIITPQSLELAVVNLPAQAPSFTAIDTRAVLADVKNGRLKRDFSTLLEQPIADIKDFGTMQGGKASADDPKTYLYGSPNVAMGARWPQLFAYYNLYKDVTLNGGEPRLPVTTKPLANWATGQGDTTGGTRFPRIAKIAYVFSYTTAQTSSTPASAYTLKLGIDVFVTLWNPYDVRLTFPANQYFLAKISKGLPFQFQWQINGVNRGGPVGLGQIIPDPAVNKKQFVDSAFYLPGGAPFSMGPGETVVFSLDSNMRSYNGDKFPDFNPGIDYKNVLAYDKVLGSSAITGAASDKISVGMAPSQGNSGSYANNAEYLDYWVYDVSKGYPNYEQRGDIIASANSPFLQNLPEVPASSVRSVTFAEAASQRQPFAAFVMQMKTAKDALQGTPAFLSGGATRLTSSIGSDPADFALDQMEYRMEAITSFQADILQTTLPGDPEGPNHSYIASGRLPSTGRTHVTALSIPTLPPVSIASFRHANTGDCGASIRATVGGVNTKINAPFTDQAVGNAYAHPKIPAASSSSGTEYDHSFLVNEALWDKWFFSSLASRNAQLATAPLKDTWSSFVDGNGKLLNPRFSVWKHGATSDTIKAAIFESGSSKLKADAYKTISSHLMLRGPFNVNSTSVEAWTSFLASTRAKQIRKLNRTGNAGGALVTSQGTLFSRTDFVLDESVDSSSNADSHYSGYRDLSNDQIKELATKIVEQVRKRGPFLNMAEFVNRRLVNDPDLSLRGALQAAIDSTDLNSKIMPDGKTGISTPNGGTFANPAAASLNTAAGAPGWLMQGDILDPLGPFITVRGDTFRIRGYGEATDPQGRVIARAWCEGVIQRVPEYIKRSDNASLFPPLDPMNVTFGREYRITGFRWLSRPDA